MDKKKKENIVQQYIATATAYTHFAIYDIGGAPMHVRGASRLPLTANAAQ